MWILLLFSVGSTLILVSLSIGKRVRSRIVAAAGISLVLFCPCYMVLELSSGPNPHISVQELAGLTPDQVIARLGPPARPDPRKPYPGHPEVPIWTPETESERGPLILEYNDYNLNVNGHNNELLHPRIGHSYEIVFRDGVVAEIAVGSR